MKYIIKSGDTLGTIAKALLGDSSRYVDILKSNNIEDPNKIFVGQILNIPKKENIEKSEDTSNSSNNFTNYIVKAGDNLSKIAREHNQDLNALIRYNNISNPNNLSTVPDLALTKIIGQVILFLISFKYSVPLFPGIIISNNIKS